MAIVHVRELLKPVCSRTLRSEGIARQATKRIRIMATLEEFDALLHAHRIGLLATADASGSPHAIPVCFVSQGGRIYSAIDHKPKRLSGYRMKRVRNMVENPRVAFVVHHYEDDWHQLYYILARGTAAILESGTERDYALTLLEQKYPQYRQHQLATSSGLVVKIVPDTVRHWSWSNASARVDEST